MVLYCLYLNEVISFSLKMLRSVGEDVTLIELLTPRSKFTASRCSEFQGR